MVNNKENCYLGLRGERVKGESQWAGLHVGCSLERYHFVGTRFKLLIFVGGR